MKKIIIPLLIFLSFLSFYLFYLKSIPIRYEDEAYWIGRSYFFELFIKTDFNNPLWQSYYSYDQPKLAEYIYGFWLFPKYLIYKREHENIDFGRFLIAHNLYSIKGKEYAEYKNNLSQFTEWGPHDYNVSSSELIKKYGEGFKKTVDLIFYARMLNALLLAGNLVIIYFLISSLSGTIIALLTTLFYGINNLILTTGLIAHSEALFLFLFSFGLYLLVRIFSNKEYGIKTLVLFGIISGLVAQTKLNGFMFLLFFWFFSIVYFLNNLWLKKLFNLKKKVILFALVNITTFLVFVFLHPLLYHNTSNNIIKIFEFRKTSAMSSASLIGPSLLNFNSRLKAIYSNFFGKDKIQSYNGVAIAKFNSFYLSPVLILFFLLGTGSSLAIIVKHGNSFTRAEIFLSLFILLQIMMGFYLYIDWDRYYAPLVLFFIYFQTLGFIRVLKFLKLKFNL